MYGGGDNRYKTIENKEKLEGKLLATQGGGKQFPHHNEKKAP